VKELWVLRHLYPAVQEHREVETDILQEFRRVLPASYVAAPAKAPRLLRYVERNAFSILFLAIYRSIGIAKDRRRLYGVVNHALRGLVTATDNLLDDEYKEMLPLAFPEKATRFKSVMHILVFDRILSETLEKAVAADVIGEESRGILAAKLFEALVAIGSEEASEEGGVTEVLTPEQILKDIHSRKGCDLLRLAFVAPRLLESTRGDALVMADQGICSIGLALQMVDDLVDIGADVRDRRHNYLVSTLWHEGTSTERRAFAGAMEEPGASWPRAEDFPAASGLVMDRAIRTAMDGVRALQQAGFWLRPELARPLLRRMFHLRGAGALWDLLPAEDGGS